jgi:hypothetical protein
MMTTMAALMGTLPIALGLGAGGESRRPLGVSVVGGLAFSQVVTLFLTPVFYIYMEQAKRWSARVFSKTATTTTADAPPLHGPISGGTVGAPIARIAVAHPLDGKSDIGSTSGPHAGMDAGPGVGLGIRRGDPR